MSDTRPPWTAPVVVRIADHTEIGGGIGNAAETQDGLGPTS